MTLFAAMIIAAIVSLIAVSALHSIAGEKLLLTPMFERRGNKVLDNALARLVLRFAWHLTSILWIMMAIILYVLVFSPEHLPSTILLTFGIGFMVVGIFDLIVSKARHMGWPVLTAIGVFCLIAYWAKDAVL